MSSRSDLLLMEAVALERQADDLMQKAQVLRRRAEKRPPAEPRFDPRYNDGTVRLPRAAQKDTPDA